MACHSQELGIRVLCGCGCDMLAEVYTASDNEWNNVLSPWSTVI